MKICHSLLAATVLTVLATNAQAEIAIDVIGGSEVMLEGIVQADAYWYDNDFRLLGSDPADGANTDFGMRRAELILKGKGPGMWSWVVGYDARADKFLDGNIAYKFNGQTSVTLGQYKQPNSLEELSSTKNNDFISKAMTTNMLSIGRRMGAKIETDYGNWGGAFSYFGNEITHNESPSLGTGRGYGLRGFFAPIKNDNRLWHFGLSYIDMKARDANDQGSARLRVRPDADMTGPRLIDTGTFTDADRLKTTGFETAYVGGPLKIQAEYLTTRISRNLNPHFSGDSWYVYGIYNLTGETWGYKNGTLTTGLPDEPGTGMWQLGLRYDTADLNDGRVDFTNPATPVVTGVMGGKQSNWTLGINWYLRSNFKLSTNYVMVDSSKYSSTLKGFQKDNPDIAEFRAQFFW